MSTIPHDRTIDSTAAFLRQGYRFVSNRCQALQSDAFETRLGLEPTVCLVGEEAAAAFYGDDVTLTRRGAMPTPVVLLLQDKGSVQALSGQAHQHRKQLFLSLLDPDAARDVATLVDEEWRRAVRRWEDAGEIVLLSAAAEVLSRSVCRWIGLSLDSRTSAARAAELYAMVDGAGAFGPRNWRGQLLRRRTERWAAGLVRQVRAAESDTDPQTPLARIALHRDLDGRLLEPEVAAVELINILRPTVAVAWWIVFAALTLIGDLGARRVVETGGEPELESFVLEVRRLYPLFPLIAGRVHGEFSWRGHRLPTGRRVVLDLYGTDHDGRIWDQPDAFQADRFIGWEGNPYTLIPQGGGDHLHTHRCPGEWVTIEVLKSAVRGLLQMRYRVPPQDLRVSLSRMPARPRSGLVLRDVHPGEE